MAHISVITITRNRPELLLRAIASVRRQRCDWTLRHLIMVDACDATRGLLAGLRLPAWTSWHWMPRHPGDRSGPGRSARLRNQAIRLARSRWIAFLDDDNEWTEDHLQELVRCAVASGSRAVHCHMQVRNRDGTPYLEPRIPWARDPAEGDREYARRRLLGVVRPGSCVYRDRADPLGEPNGVRSVDTGEWLLARTLLLEVPFAETFDQGDEADLRGEDDKLLAALLAREELIVCNGKATLIYYLGGYSNNFTEQFDPSFAWV